MEDNIYAVTPLFPNGVMIPQLAIELEVVWPANIFPVSMTHRGKPGVGGVITAGNLTIATQLVLTTPQNDAALAHFLLHDPIVGGQGGTKVAQLSAGYFNGETVFVLDELRQGNGSSGVPCYWDGRDRTWRRVRDDWTVAIIP